MNKITNLFKSLLVAAVLGIGSNAWGQVSSWTYSSTLASNTFGAEFDGSTSGVLKVQLGTNSESATWAIYNVNSKNRGVYSSASKSWDPTNTAIPTGGTFMIVKPTKDLHLDVNVFNGATKQQIKYSDLASPTKSTTLNGGYNVNANTQKDIEVGNLTAGHTYYVFMGTNDWAIASFTAKTIESYTIHFQDDEGNTIKEDVVRTGVYGASVTAADADMESINYLGDDYAYDSGNETIVLGSGTNEITLRFVNASIANYTIKYVDDSATPVTIKDDLVIESYVGAEVTATGVSLPSYITYNDVRYKYVTGNKDLTVSGDAVEDVITLVYTPCDVFSYTVKGYDSSDNILATIASGTWVEGDAAISVAYPRYILSGTTLYCGGTGAISYKTTFTPDADDYVKKITYNSGTVSNVVYYTEGENVTGASQGANADRASVGKMGYTANSSTYLEVTTLDPGIYKLYARGQNGNSAARAFSFKVGDTEVHSGSITNGTNKDSNSGDFLVTSASTLSFACVGSSQSGMDYFYVVKTGECYESMSIVGDFSENAWDETAGIEMTRDAENPHVWTAVVKDFVVTSSKYNYEYKSVANGNWDDYVLPAVDNQTYNFDYDGARQGKYTLTFTVNTSTHTVSMVPTKQPTATVYFVNTGDWTTPKAWVWDSTNSNYNYTGGEWPGQSMSATGEQIDGKDVYEWSTYDITGAPNYVIFSDNGSNQTSDLAFVNGAIYNASGSTINVKTISAAGWATYCSPFALDFTNAIANLDAAYIVTGGADGVLEMTEVKGIVPANTGLLLKGEGDVAFPVASSDANVDVSANKLEGVTENTVIAAEAGYVLMASPSLGFYKNSNAFTVGANTAYLPADFDVTSARFFLLDGGKTTSISEQLTVNSEKLVYDLQGRRVNSSLKPGLYIMSGKKVVIK